MKNGHEDSASAKCLSVDLIKRADSRANCVSDNIMAFHGHLISPNLSFKSFMQVTELSKEFQKKQNLLKKC